MFWRKKDKITGINMYLFLDTETADGEDFDETQNASVDTKATERCFWEMRRIGII